MEQRSILITGCSSGIGLCAATELKKRGWRVFAAARKPHDLEKLTELGLESISLNLQDSESIQKAVKQVVALTGGTLDALFNNAGLLVAGATEDISRDLTRAQFETNVFGPMELIRHVLPIMRKQGHGRIVQNSSILGVITMPYYGAYNASKFALEAFSHTLRQELRGTNIHVAIINPGPIVTELRNNAHQIFEDSVAPQTNGEHQQAYEKLANDYFKPSAATRKIQLTPDAVVQQLIHALQSKRPHVHYFTGWPAKILAFAKRILPDHTFDSLIAKIKG
jgi:NAD(P)-dependent dehydrogenase (short-subunit alcohol dehydrogenase family)